MAKKEKKEKKAKKKEPRSDIKRMKGSVVPAAFSDFVEMMESLGEATHKDTVTTFKNDDIGVFVTIPKQGSTEDKISLFLNKSRGWKPEGVYSELEVEKWHTGDVRVIVSDSPKAMKQAYKLCKEWSKDKDEHTPTPTEKKAKSDDDDKPSKKKNKKNKKEKKNGEDTEMSAKSKKRRKKKHSGEGAEADA
jgi:hypothetical protein